MRHSKRDNVPRRGRWWKAGLRGIVVYLLGTLTGPVILQKFAGWLPGPQAVVSVKALQDTQRVCTFYQFALTTDRPLDYMYFKVEFPGNITSYKIGRPLEGIDNEHQRLGMQAWEVGRESGGECAVISAAVNADVPVDVIGSVVTVREAKLPPSSVIVGLIATPGIDKTQQNAEKYFEGAYEYTMLGLTLRKPIHVIDDGVTVAADK